MNRGTRSRDSDSQVAMEVVFGVEIWREVWGKDESG